MRLPRWLRPPGGDLNWIAPVLVVLGAGMLPVPFVARPAVLNPTFAVAVGVVGVLVLAAGVGLWFRRRWARWITFGLAVLHVLLISTFAIASLTGLIQAPFSWRRIL